MECACWTHFYFFFRANHGHIFIIGEILCIDKGNRRRENEISLDFKKGKFSKGFAGKQRLQQGYPMRNKKTHKINYFTYQFNTLICYY